MKWLGSMMLVALVGCGDVPVNGEISVRMGQETAAIVMPSECVENGTDRGAGVELWDEAGWSFHFRHDSLHGASMLVSSPGNEEIAVLVPSECEVFRGELRRRTEIEDELIHVTYGHLDLQCHRADGVVVEAELDFDHCTER